MNTTENLAELRATPAAPALARQQIEPVTLAEVLDALNLFNRPKPDEDDGPWEAEHFIRVDFLPAFINAIAAAWFTPALAAAGHAPDLQSIEQYRMQMAGISSAALGYWQESDSIHPDYDTVALRDVAKLYAKYDKLYKAAGHAPKPLTDEQHG